MAMRTRQKHDDSHDPAVRAAVLGQHLRDLRAREAALTAEILQLETADVRPEPPVPADPDSADGMMRQALNGFAPRVDDKTPAIRLWRALREREGAQAAIVYLSAEHEAAQLANAAEVARAQRSTWDALQRKRCIALAELIGANREVAEFKRALKAKIGISPRLHCDFTQPLFQGKALGEVRAFIEQCQRHGIVSAAEVRDVVDG